VRTQSLILRSRPKAGVSKDEAREPSSFETLASLAPQDEEH
jgi:hypothetical protein